MVQEFRAIVQEEIDRAHSRRAETPLDNYGDPMPTFDVFTELTKQYEAAAKKRRA